jgi:hypothetical protein
MTHRLLAISVLAATVALVSIPHVAAAASVTAAATGSFTAPGGSGPVGGAFTLERFANDDGELVALGTLAYSLCVPNVDPKNCLATVTQEVAIPVTALSVSGTDLQLSLGPLTLVSPPSLSDFTIQFDVISLNIASASQPAQGLLSAIAHRVDAAGVAGEIAPMLNQFIRILGDP